MQGWNMKPFRISDLDPSIGFGHLAAMSRVRTGTRRYIEIE